MKEATMKTREGRSERSGAMTGTSRAVLLQGQGGLDPITGTPDTREALNHLLGELRPKLHRYCARMTGSVVDGEDVVQDALVKAIEAFSQAGSIANPEAWLFRIAHNAALDFLRHRARHNAAHADKDLEMIVDPVTPISDRQIAAASLRTFMHLPVVQRSSVILMDVLGYSLQEICAIMKSSLPAVKAALHRGRRRLRELAQAPADLPPPVLAEPECSRLARYVDCFNARDFDAIRHMLAEDVRLDLVARQRMHGRSAVAKYFDSYALVQDWHLVPGCVDRRPAVLVRDPHDAVGRPAYFVLVEWAGDRLVNIQDFRFARYAIEGAEIWMSE
jgi:RNA polymerase sigma-70 factor (ECF subfamily)